MFKALLRYLIIEVPVAFLSGLSYIIFDKQEIIQTEFILRKQIRINIADKVLKDYLKKCYKLVYTDEKEDEKRLDKN